MKTMFEEMAREAMRALATLNRRIAAELRELAEQPYDAERFRIALRHMADRAERAADAADPPKVTPIERARERRRGRP